MVNTKSLQTSNESDSEQPRGILKKKGKGKAATVEDVEDESDGAPRAKPKGKGRAATVEDVEDEYDAAAASSVQSEGEPWDENGNGGFSSDAELIFYTDVLKFQSPLLDFFVRFGYLRSYSVELSRYVVIPY